MSQTWDEFMAKQQAFLQEMKGEAKAFGIAVSTVHSDVSKRIFVSGQASDGSQIGNYNSTKEIWVAADDAPQTPPRGKPGTERIINNRRAVYFESYKAFRAAQGRETEFVNLRLTNLLQNDFNTGLAQINATTWQAILKNQANVKKARGNEDRFGKPIFNVTQAEQKRLAEVFDFEIQKQLNAMAA